MTGIDDGEDVDVELLTGIYERVRANQFQPSADHVLQVVKVEQMILGKKPVSTAVSHYCLVFSYPHRDYRQSDLLRLCRCRQQRSTVG